MSDGQDITYQTRQEGITEGWAEGGDMSIAKAGKHWSYVTSAGECCH